MNTPSDSLFAKISRAGVAAALAGTLILGAGLTPAQAQGRCDNSRQGSRYNNGYYGAQAPARLYRSRPRSYAARGRAVDPYYSNVRRNRYANGNYGNNNAYYGYNGPAYNQGYNPPYFDDDDDPFRRRSSKGKTAVTIIAGTAGGAAVGGLLGGKKGAILGAVVGAAGTSIYSATKNRNRNRYPQFPY
jgi:hypothetical protein